MPDSLETVEATAYGIVEVDFPGVVHICDWNIAVAAAHRRFDGRHRMRDSADLRASTIFEYYKIWT